MDMCKLRNTHPAFNGSFEVLDAVVDIQQYSEQLHALEPGSSSAFLTERLGMAADVAVSLDGRGWCVPPPSPAATSLCMFRTTVVWRRLSVRLWC